MRTAAVFIVVIALTAITTSLEAGGGVEPPERCVNVAGEETTPDGRRK